MESTEQSSNATSIRILQDALNYDVAGVLWFTKTSLGERPSPFDSLDYFFEGILTQNLRKNGYDGAQKNFFFTSSFGRPFFLGHFMAGMGDLEKNLKELFKILDGQLGENKKVLLIDRSGQKLETMLKKKFPALEFQPIDTI